jgi:peptidoglycan/LPS O-acetylase OafA/YrhL
MKAKKISFILCYGISAVVFAVVTALGITLKPGNEMGFSLLDLYLVLPITSYIGAFLLGAIRPKLFWVYPIVFAIWGTLIPHITFHYQQFMPDALAFSAIPPCAGFLFGVLINIFAVRNRKTTK